MAKLVWNRDIVGQLADLVRTHNEAIADPERRTKLTELKKLYARAYNGRTDEAARMAAIGSVERHLEKLAKSFDSGKHPRGQKGEFAAGGAKAAGKTPTLADLPLPKTAAQHEALQESSPAYSALTSDAVPEFRNAVTGSIVRNVGSAAVGAALVLSLSRGGAGGRAGQIIQRSLRRAGGVTTGVPTAAVTYGVAGIGHALAGKLARRMGRNVGEHYGAARAATAFATKMGQKAGSGVGWGIAHGAHLVVDSATRAAGDFVHPRVARAGVLTGLSLGTGAVISSQIAGTGVDPERIGSGIDAYSYRTIRKMAGGDDVLDAVAADVLAKFGGEAVADVLEKAGFYGALGQKVLTGAAAIAGAAVAGGAAEAGHAIAGGRTDPYRDAKGRFASRADAVTAGSAIAGAVAAGAGAYLALRNHNVGVLVRHVDAVADTIGRHMAAVHSPEGVGSVADLIRSGGGVPELVANRSQAIHAHMNADPEFAAARKSLDSYGGSSEAYLKATVRAEVNHKLANSLSGYNDFRIYGADGKHVTVGQVRNGAGPIKGDQAAFRAVHDVIDGISGADFEKGIANLSPTQQETARHWMTRRESALESIPGDIKRQADKIDAAARATDEARTRKESLRTAMEDARAVVDRAEGDEQKSAAETAYAAAAKEHEAAGKAVDKAEKAHAKLLEQPSGVTSPVTGKPIPPATQAELAPHHARLRGEAQARAAAAVDKQIGKAKKKFETDVRVGRERQAADLTSKGDRMLAARAALGHSLGVLPSQAAFAGVRAASLRRSIGRARDTLVAAESDLAAAQKRAAHLKLVARGKMPKGMSPEDAAALHADAGRVQAAVGAAELRVSQAKGKVSAREFLLRKHSARFLTAVKAQPIVEQRVGKLPHSVYRGLLRDVARASEDVRRPVNAFLHSPSAQALKNFAASIGEGVADVGTSIGHGVRDTFRAAAMRQTPDGRWAIDPRKAIIGGGVVGAVTADVTHDLYHYGKDHISAALGLSDGPAKSRFPKSIRVEKHIDPLNGGGFVGISVPDPDPDGKGERLLLWGERYKDATSPPEPLHVGSRVSALRSRLAGGGQPGGGAAAGGGQQRDSDLANLPDDTKQAVGKALGEMKDRMNVVRVEDGHEVRYRPNGDDVKNDAVGSKVEQHIKTSFLSGGNSPTGKLYYDALGAVVGSRQGRILKQKQAYRLLTGFATGGQKQGTGIFHAGDDSDFAEQGREQVLGALKDEVDRALDKHPPADDAQRTNLVRAVATVGQQKGVGQADLKPLYEKIRGTSARAGAAAPKIIQATPLPARAHEPITASTPTTSHLWDQKDLREASLKHATVLGRQIGITSEERVADLATVIEHLAGAAHHSHELPMSNALFAAADTIKAKAGGPYENKRMTLDALKDVDPTHFMSELSDQADAQLDRIEKQRKVQKAAYLDDIDGLFKNFVDDAIDAVSDEPRATDGKWSVGGAARTAARRVATNLSPDRASRETVEEGADRAGRSATTAAPSPKASNYTPTKIGSDIGGAVLGEAASYGASKILGRLFPEEEGAVGIIQAVRQAYGTGGASAAARAVGGHAAKTVGASAAGLAGYGAGAAAGGGAVRAAYGAVGAKAPDAVPVKTSVGEGVAESLGNVGGAIIGGALGSGIGSIATGAAGGYLGGIIGRNAYDVGSKLSRWFDGYDKNQAADLVRRHSAPRQPRAAA